MKWIEQAGRLLRSMAGAPLFRAKKVVDAPDTFDPKTVYLLAEGRTAWCAKFICPCGCGETISLSLIRGDRPRWRALRHNDGTVSIHPSIWRIKGCKSHFFIRRGRVIWARATWDATRASRRSAGRS